MALMEVPRPLQYVVEQQEDISFLSCKIIVDVSLSDMIEAKKNSILISSSLHAPSFFLSVQ
jgi:hypothetical protein